MVFVEEPGSVGFGNNTKRNTPAMVKSVGATLLE